MSSETSTSDAILATARRLFHSRGYNDVGINDICREADVVKGSFYHFFAGKQALLEAVVDANRNQLLAGLRKLNREPLSGRDKLVAQLRGVLEESRTQKRNGAVLGCNLGTLANELAVYNDVARRHTRRAFRDWLKVLEGMIREGIDDHSLAADLDPAVTAASLLALMQGVSTLGRTFGNPRQLEKILGLAERQLLVQP